MFPRVSLRKRFNLPPETKIIGTVGDLWKNQIEFLDAFASYSKGRSLMLVLH